MSKNRLHSVVQRFNLNFPEGGLLTDTNCTGSKVLDIL